MNTKKSNRRKSEYLQEYFARNVRIERTRLGVTQDELAEICGYHRTYIGSVERGERNITLATVEALAKALDIEPHLLLLGNNE